LKGLFVFLINCSSSSFSHFFSINHLFYFDFFVIVLNLPSEYPNDEQVSYGPDRGTYKIYKMLKWFDYSNRFEGMNRCLACSFPPYISILTFFMIYMYKASIRKLKELKLCVFRFARRLRAKGFPPTGSFEGNEQFFVSLFVSHLRFRHFFCISFAHYKLSKITFSYFLNLHCIYLIYMNIQRRNANDFEHC